MRARGVRDLGPPSSALLRVVSQAQRDDGLLDARCRAAKRPALPDSSHIGHSVQRIGTSCRVRMERAPSHWNLDSSLKRDCSGLGIVISLSQRRGRCFNPQHTVESWCARCRMRLPLNCLRIGELGFPTNVRSASVIPLHDARAQAPDETLRAGRYPHRCRAHSTPIRGRQLLDERSPSTRGTAPGLAQRASASTQGAAYARRHRTSRSRDLVHRRRR